MLSTRAPVYAINVSLEVSLAWMSSSWPVPPLTGRLHLQVTGPDAELAMRNEVFARGPITCSMATPETFDYGKSPWPMVLGHLGPSWLVL